MTTFTLSVHSIRQLPGQRLTTSVITNIAELALAFKITTTECLPGLRPVLTSASREIILQLLALLCAIFEHTCCAHVRLAHCYIEPRLLLAGFKLICEGQCKEAKHHNGLHC